MLDKCCQNNAVQRCSFIRRQQYCWNKREQCWSENTLFSVVGTNVNNIDERTSCFQLLKQSSTMLLTTKYFRRQFEREEPILLVERISRCMYKRPWRTSDKLKLQIQTVFCCTENYNFGPFGNQL